MTTSKTRFISLAGVLLLGLPIAACGKKDDAAVIDTSALGTTLAPAALTVTDVQIGKSIGADKRVTNQTSTFGVRDTMYVAVVTSGASTGAKLTARWTYNGPNVVNESSQTISPTGGENVTEFHIDKRSPWQKGSYRVDVLLDGAPAQSMEFDVK